MRFFSLLFVVLCVAACGLKKDPIQPGTPAYEKALKRQQEREAE